MAIGAAVRRALRSSGTTTSLSPSHVRVILRVAAAMHSAAPVVASEGPHGGPVGVGSMWVWTVVLGGRGEFPAAADRRVVGGRGSVVTVVLTVIPTVSSPVRMRAAEGGGHAQPGGTHRHASMPEATWHSDSAERVLRGGVGRLDGEGNPEGGKALKKKRYEKR
jgi:hypothetical protein